MIFYSFQIVAISVLVIFSHILNKSCADCCYLIGFNVDFKNLKGSDVRLDKANTFDFEILPLTFEDESEIAQITSKSYSKYPFTRTPIDVIIYLFEYLDVISLGRYMSSNKFTLSHFTWCISEIVRIKIGLNINIPRKNVLAFYSAFCVKTPDYSQIYDGLEGKPIEFEDFIALNVICACDRSQSAGIKFNNFIPELNMLSVQEFAAQNSSQIIPEHLKTFKYLSSQVGAFREDETDSIDQYLFMPYTFWALELAGKQAINNFMMKHFDSINFNVLARFYDYVPLNSLFEVGIYIIRIYMIEGSCVDVIEAHLSFISDAFCRASGFDPSLAKAYILHEVLMDSFDTFCLDAEDYIRRLQNPHKIITLKNLDFYWPDYLLSLIPEQYLQKQHYALKNLMSKSFSDFNFAYFFEEFNDPDSFKLCLEVIFTSNVPNKADFILEFVKHACTKFDLSVPRSDEYKIVFEIEHLYPINVFERFLEFLKSNNKAISLLEIRNNHPHPVFHFPTGFIPGHLTSHFDLLFISNQHIECFERILNAENVNSKFVFPIAMFGELFHMLIGTYWQESIESQVIEIILTDQEWTFIELAFAVGHDYLIQAILNHPGFNRNELEHEVNGERGISFIMANIVRKYNSKNENIWLKLENLELEVQSIL